MNSGPFYWTQRSGWRPKRFVRNVLWGQPTIRPSVRWLLVVQGDDPFIVPIRIRRNNSRLIGRSCLSMGWVAYSDDIHVIQWLVHMVCKYYGLMVSISNGRNVTMKRSIKAVEWFLVFEISCDFCCKVKLLIKKVIRCRRLVHCGWHHFWFIYNLGTIFVNCSRLRFPAEFVQITNSWIQRTYAVICLHPQPDLNQLFNAHCWCDKSVKWNTLNIFLLRRRGLQKYLPRLLTWQCKSTLSAIKYSRTPAASRRIRAKLKWRWMQEKGLTVNTQRMWLGRRRRRRRRTFQRDTRFLFKRRFYYCHEMKYTESSSDDFMVLKLTSNASQVEHKSFSTKINRDSVSVCWGQIVSKRTN